MTDLPPEYKRLWEGLSKEEQDLLQRIGNKEELFYPDDDVTLSHLRFSGLILIVVLEGAQPW